MAAVNGWDDVQKLQWLQVRVTGRAQKMLHRLTGAAAASNEATQGALCARFEPESRRMRHQAEFQARRKRPGKGCAHLADDLRSLADKAYPTLQEEARERLSISTYLTQLPQPQLSFSVRQKQPSTLDDAVVATLQMESYLPSQQLSSVSTTVTGHEEDSTTACWIVDAVDPVSHLTRMVEKLADQVEKLQLQTTNASPQVEWLPTREGRGRCSVEEGSCKRVLELPPEGSLAHNFPVSQIQKPTGKLDNLSTVDRVSGGCSGEVQTPIAIFPITSGSRLPGSSNRVNFTLLLDTGATVTLLREGVWIRIAASTGYLKT